MRNFRNYNVWKKAISFSETIYAITDQLPQSERYGLISQLQRATISISSNIVEGCSRSSEKDFARFIEIALGSSFEVESQLYVSQELKYLRQEEMIKIISELEIIQKQLNALYVKLKR